MKFSRLIIFSLFSFQTSFGQTWQDTLSQIDKAFIQYKPENPGCQLSISRDGLLIFSKSWGMADLEHNVPLSTNSILEAGSVSKQFTATAILLLQQQRKLSLDDDVRKYIPELPNYGTSITLKQLIHHTSGLREWSDIADLTGWSRGQKFYTNQDILEMLIYQKQLNFKPGDEFLYSNSNYCLLTLIVERVSSLSLPAFTEKYIFKPAGMTHTQWRDDPKSIVVDRAIAYSKSDNSYRTNMPNEYVYGPGGLLTTTEDLLKWNNFYQSGKLGNASVLSEQLKTEPLNNGVMNNYAAGLFINKIMGWHNISHDGATASYRAYLETFPELHLSIALLSNTSQFNIDNVENIIRKIFVQDKTEKKKESDSSIKLPVTYLKTMAGMYVNERNHSTFQLSIKNDTLMLDNYLPLISVSENIFKSNNFLFDITGTKGLYITFTPKDTIHFSKVKSVSLSEKYFNMYKGKYFSEETNSSLLIKDDSRKLIMQFNAAKSYTLTPTYKDAFNIEDLGCDVQFIRSPQNKISSMKFYFWRTRGVKFKKINGKNH